MLQVLPSVSKKSMYVRGENLIPVLLVKKHNYNKYYFSSLYTLFKTTVVILCYIVATLDILYNWNSLLASVL